MSDVKLPTTEELTRWEETYTPDALYGRLISAARQAIQLQAEVTRLREERFKLAEAYRKDAELPVGATMHRDLVDLLDAIEAESGKETTP